MGKHFGDYNARAILPDDKEANEEILQCGYCSDQSANYSLPDDKEVNGEALPSD